MPLSPHRRVLVLGDDARFLLPIARSLGRRQIEVHLAGCPEGEYCLRSRYVRASHPLAPFEAAPQAWRDSLARIWNAASFDLVIPASERYVYLCHQRRELLTGGPPIYLLSQEAFETFVDKRATCALARRLGIPIAQEYPITGDTADARQFKSLRWPAVLKPACSTDPAQIDRKRFVRLVRNHDELRAALDESGAGDHQYVLQQFVRGSGVGIGFLADRGTVQSAFQHVRLHETTGHGSTYRMSVKLEQHLLAAVQSLAAAVNYTGVGMAEFRVDSDTGNWVLVEVNGRFWGSLPLAVASGADFPRYLYELLVEGSRSPETSYRVGVRCRSLFADLRWYLHRATRHPWGADGSVDGQTGWATNPRSARQLLTDTLRGLLLQDHLDSFSRDDPLPAFAELALIARTVVGKTVRLALPYRQARSA
jgi:predicted ATP-grasp superfamily ATP-dependent carboligase